jgi:hypothetical protein
MSKPVDLAALRQVAERAVSAGYGGPLYARDNGDASHYEVGLRGEDGSAYRQGAIRRELAVYLAAVPPDVLLSLLAEVDRLRRVEEAARFAAHACTPKCWQCGRPATTQARNGCHEHFCDDCWAVAKDKKTSRLEPHYDNPGPIGPCPEVLALIAALEAK